MTHDLTHLNVSFGEVTPAIIGFLATYIRRTFGTQGLRHQVGQLSTGIWSLWKTHPAIQKPPALTFLTGTFFCSDPSAVPTGVDTVNARELQPSKANFPSCVTDCGMVTCAKEQQFANAPGSIWVTEFGMIKFTKDLQSAKARTPIRVTESEMVKFTRELQPSKA